MNALRTLIALSAATLATACAAPGDMNTSQPLAPAMTGMAGMGAPMPIASMEPRMKAMQGGMAMMKEMHGGMQAMGGMGGGNVMPADMAKRHQMMTDHMASMQMMMNMMSDRMPPATP